MTSTGTCKSFNGPKGWGFIVGGPEFGGVDIFVHIKDCADGGQPQQGDVLMFTTEESRTKPGQLCAKNVQGGTAPRDAPPGMAMGGMGMGMGMPMQAAASFPGFAGPVQGTGAYTGTVKSFNPEKGFGFIEIQGQDNNIFFHTRQCVGSQPVAGDSVKFDLEPSQHKQGQFQATNVTGGSVPLGSGKGGKAAGKGGYGAVWGGMDQYGCMGGMPGMAGMGGMASMMGGMKGGMMNMASPYGW